MGKFNKAKETEQIKIARKAARKAKRANVRNAEAIRIMDSKNR